ncbi:MULTISPECIES: DUF6705 family protein [unclassified Flavobacterium]|uniref:DUF6705 family protein n=1 Tax=unclassified Flavobacterium TaxID=196869 RepID=UPI0008684F02|nr:MULTISPECIES: DUF6705 family protein [unclassified Flavobacterium]MBN9282822.1 hypothetical protein [Flavobacterium sp.]ODS84025.1 MAG: hypothetical protein ABS44_16825 [Chryseobacterium sp. SCN 40-13]OJV72344.1 MAG: hypothetical protein BGO42_11460 [Flavobacterium sp. 40-81]
MKTILTILLVSFFLSCKTQTIIPIAGEYNPQKYKSGTYNKDVDNDFDKYVGTWRFQQGNASLIIVFKKIVHDYFAKGNFYEDLLVGEYQYIINGVEIVNTLDRINIVLSQDDVNNIEGNLIIHRGVYPQCSECSLNEKRIKLHIRDSEREYLDNAIVLRYKNENGTEKIIAKIFKNGTSFMPPDNAPDEMRVPYGEYVLIKQP